MMNKSFEILKCSDNIQLGPGGVSIPSPGEPSQGAKDFFWTAAGVAVAAVGIGLAIMFGCKGGK